MTVLILKVLILGGTSFLGPHLVQVLQERGHEVTLFNRGNHCIPFSNVEKLQGDRDGNLEALKERNWDIVIDTSGHIPRIVKESSKLLAHATKHYTFVSTIGVYQDFNRQVIDENSPLAQLDDKETEEITEKTYGALKAACEQMIQDYFPNRHLIVRPGLIVGPGDSTHRFSYWPLRVKNGGEILAPGSPYQYLQFIDVRDLAEWIVTMVEKQATGIYNVTGPAKPLKFEDFLYTCQHEINRNVSFTWVSEDFLIQHQIQDWTEIPLWLSYKRNMPGFLSINILKALQAGLTFRPLSNTLRSILDWNKEKEIQKEKIGLTQEKEQNLLNLWKQNEK